MLDTLMDIEEFPGYLVSSRGIICNDRTGRFLAQSKNQNGVVFVGLVRDGKQYKRSVALLVAKAFLPKEDPRLDTPMHLDCNREHNWVENLVWRTRSFVHTYYHQFNIPDEQRFLVGVQDIDSGEYFETPRDAAMAYGILERAIVMSAYDEDGKTRVFPTRQRFRFATE